jgi:hypothetical protein
VRSVLQLIADFTNLNLVASDTVQGGILRLQNVPWDQALDLVLKTKGLDKRKIGNVLLVAPADEIAARERRSWNRKNRSPIWHRYGANCCRSITPSGGYRQTLPVGDQRRSENR